MYFLIIALTQNSRSVAPALLLEICRPAGFYLQPRSNRPHLVYQEPLKAMIRWSVEHNYG